jgi:hypothetical protein
MAAIDDLVNQILGQKTTAKWTGEGYGGAEANAKAMAKLLADAGITDIKQFGKVDKYEPVEVTGYSLNGRSVQNPSKGVYYEMIPEPDGEGGISGYSRRNLTPAEAAQVKPQYGIEEYDSEGMRSVRQPTSVVEKDGKMMGVYGTTYGNKATGQAIQSGTGRWQKQGGEDLFGGTGEGKGNTAFRAEFTPDGTPVFYTTQGTSNDLALALQGLGPVGSIAANYLAMQFGGPAAVAALNAAQGKDFKDVAKATLLAYAGQELSSSLGGGGTDGLLGSQPTSGFYDEITGAFVPDANGLLNAPLTDLSGTNIGSMSGYNYDPVTGDWTMPSGDVVGTTINPNPVTSGSDIMSNANAMPTEVTPTTSGYYNEITGEFIHDVNGPLQGPLTNATSGTNIGSMAGYNYNPTTGDWTLPTGEVIGTTVNPNPVTDGGEIMRNAGAMSVAPVAPKAATTAAGSGLGVSDALRAAGLVATIAGANNVMGSGGGGGYDIVPIPSDWTSPIKPTGVAEFTPLAPIDFGNKEMLQGTQWEKLLDPNYGQAPAMPSQTNPSNMNFDQLMGILGNSRTSIPTQSVSINDVIAGIQSQYGQTPQGSMG